jgi:hypothetical protein
MITILKNIFLALLLSVLCTLIYLQYDLHVHNAIQQKFKNTFEQLFDCSCSCSIETINIFWPTLTVKNMHVRSKDPAKPWHWHAQRYTMQFSWWHLLLHGSINLGIRITNPHVESEFQQGSLAIAGHIQKMIRGSPSIPILIQHIIIGPIHCIIHDAKKEHELELDLDSKTKMAQGALHTIITLKNGAYRKSGQTLIHSLQTQLSIKSLPFLRITLAKECSCIIEHLANKPIACAIHGSWYRGRAQLAFTTADNSITVDKLTITKKDGTIALQAHGNTTLSFLQECATQLCAKSAQPISGAVSFDLQMQTAGHSYTPHITGTIACNKIQYQERPIADACIQFKNDDKHWHGSLQLTPHAQAEPIQGTWSFDTATRAGSCSIQVDKPIALTPTCILTHADVHVNINDKAQYSGTITAAVDYADNIIHTNATIQGSGKQYIIEGVCTNQSKQPIAQFAYSHATNMCKGSIDIARAQPYLEPYGNFYQGVGNLHFDIACTAYPAITGSYAFDGIVRPAQLYNCITNVGGTLALDLLQKKCALSTHAQCTYGTITANCFAQWNDTYQLEFLKAPCSFSAYQLRFGKNMQATISGNMLITAHKDQTPTLNGHLIVDTARIEYNLLTPTFFKKIIQTSQANMPALPSFTCNLHIETKAPLTIKTDLMQTHAKINAHLHNTSQDPKLVGTLELIGGSLKFPYKPLFIHKGVLTFFNDIRNPFIEIVAKNSIKQHEVTLALNGILHDYAVSLSANPALHENQIVSLLFMGFPDQSLKPLVPALVTNRIKNWFFDSRACNPTSAWHMIPHLLRRVHLVPLFTDQTARGGIRAAFEIELADHIRALIQKNFTLTEDTRFELEYQLSDNITLRGVRDERRDVNGQIEMRWKF